MNYVFTKNGERKVEHFIQSCVEKRKRMVEEGIDTDDLIDNARNLSAKDILLSINYFHASDLKKHTYSVLITDHFRGELTLIYEADFIKCEKQSIIDDAINKEHLAEDIVDVFENLLDEKNIEILDRLKEYGVNMRAEETETVESVLTGKTVVVTGTLPALGRKEASELIEKYGGKASGSVSKKTDYVLAGENAGSKLTKAQELGIPVISEEQLKEMLGI